MSTLRTDSDSPHFPHSELLMLLFLSCGPCRRRSHYWVRHVSIFQSEDLDPHSKHSDIYAKRQKQNPKSAALASQGGGSCHLLMFVIDMLHGNTLYKHVLGLSTPGKCHSDTCPMKKAMAWEPRPSTLSPCDKYLHVSWCLPCQGLFEFQIYIAKIQAGRSGVYEKATKCCRARCIPGGIRCSLCQCH